MMKNNRYFWSPSASGFYDRQVSDMENAPDDLVPITNKKWAQLLLANQNGATIISDDDGQPIAVHPVKPSAADVKRWATRRIKAEAARRIKMAFPLTAQMNAMREGKADDLRFTAVDRIRAASNLIEQDLADSASPENFPVADHPLWPETDI